MIEFLTKAPCCRITCRCCNEHFDRLRNGHECHCEDDRHNAAHCDLYGNVSVLTAVLLSSHNTLSVLNGNTSFSLVHKNDEADHYNINEKNEDNGENVLVGVAYSELNHILYIAGASCDDSGEEDNRDTVSDTVFVYQVAEENDEV